MKIHINIVFVFFLACTIMACGGGDDDNASDSQDKMCDPLAVDPNTYCPCDTSIYGPAYSCGIRESNMMRFACLDIHTTEDKNKGKWTKEDLEKPKNYEELCPWQQ